MNKRILEIRKTLNLSQEKFGKQLGVTKAGISKIEVGERGITDTMIKLICSTYNVNESWLRTGDGDMFVNHNAKFANFLGSLFKAENSFKKRAVEVLSQLTDEQWELLEKMVKELTRKD